MEDTQILTILRIKLLTEFLPSSKSVLEIHRRGYFFYRATVESSLRDNL